MDVAQVERWVPGVRVARTYRQAWLKPDLVSGVVDGETKTGNNSSAG